MIEDQFAESTPAFVQAGWDFLAMSRELQVPRSDMLDAIVAQCEGRPPVLVQRSTATREISLDPGIAGPRVQLRCASAKEFRDEPLQFHSFCGCLAESCGPRDAPEAPRPDYRFFQTPSAGNLISTSVWIAARNVRSIEPGIYFLERAELSLREYRASPNGLSLAYESLLQDQMRGAAVLVFIAVSFDRLYQKYGARGFRLGLLEAGHLGQALYMAAYRYGLRACAVAGYMESQVNDILHLDGKDNSVVYCVALGMD